ncbi:RHS repeat domain-containing protein [Chryseobacterium sp.]|uniref:RHS repeat domain-containing protein n=1 Tax=Chryseobacterium sp. TaxID=1871047 RepID=UPI00388DD2FA
MQKAGFYQKEEIESSKEYYEKMEYDINGNSRRLKRSEQLLLGSTTALAIDNLKYDYTGNRLTKATDEQQNPSGYPYFSTTQIIKYDNNALTGNGNMTDDKDKNISNIKYNYFNLSTFVDAVTGGGFPYLDQEGQKHNYKYRADGIKYYTRVDDVSPYMQKYSINEYLDGFQYQQRYTKMNTAQNPSDTGMVLKFYPTSEGYFDFDKNKYIYNYTDHLGNVRLSYFYNGSGVEVLDENNYYPFGLRHSGYNILAGNSSYHYKYNGKELQETGMYDYGARFYMPDIGRWGVVDPLAEKYFNISPFNYTANNPILYIDPDGMQLDLSNIMKKGNEEQYKAFVFFAKTKEGQSFLSKYM